MSFENENVFPTTVKWSESPGDNSTIVINTRVSNYGSMLPILTDESSMKVNCLDMPLLEDSQLHLNTEFNIKLSDSEPSNPSVVDNDIEDFSSKKMIKNGIDSRNTVAFGNASNAQEEYSQSVGFDSLDSGTNAFSNDATLINNTECQPEIMDIPDDILEYSSTVSFEKLADYCCTEDEISEFLIFLKKEQTTDEKLKYGCFVKLERISVPVVRQKRNTKAIERYYPSPKRLRSQATTASNRSRKKRTNEIKHTTKGEIEHNSRGNITANETDKCSSDSAPNHIEQCKIVLRFVRPIGSSFHKCFDLSNINEDQSNSERELYPANVKQPFKRHLESGERIILPESNADRSDRPNNQSDTRNAYLQNVKQPIQTHSRLDNQIILPKSNACKVSPTNVEQPAQLHSKSSERSMLPESEAGRSDRSKDQSYTKRNRSVSPSNLKQPLQKRSRSSEQTSLPESKAGRSDQSKDQSYTTPNRKVSPPNVKQPVQITSINSERTRLPESKAGRSDGSDDQSYTKPNRDVSPPNVKQPVPSSERTRLPESKAGRSDQSKDQSYTTPNRKMSPPNVKQPVQITSINSERTRLPESKVGKSVRFKDRSYSKPNRNVSPPNVKQPVQITSRSSEQTRLPESKAGRSDRSNDQSYTKPNRAVSPPNVKQPEQINSRSSERTRLSDSKAIRSDRSKDKSYTKPNRNMFSANVKQPVKVHLRLRGSERYTLPESKACRSDRSNDQSYIKPNRNMSQTNVKQPVQMNSRGVKRIIISEPKADRSYQSEDESDTNRDVYPTNVKQSVQLNAKDYIDEQMILPTSNAYSSSHLSTSFNKSDAFMEANDVETIATRNGVNKNYAIEPHIENYIIDQPLDLTMSKNRNINICQGESTVKTVKQNITKDTIADSHLDKIKQTIKEVFGSSSDSFSSDDENTMSSIKDPQQDLQANFVDDTNVASNDSDDNSSVSSELSIFAPSLSELSDSPRESAPRIAKIQNSILEIKKFRIPKIKRCPDESVKQLDVERPNTKPQPIDTFGYSRDHDVVQSKKRKNVPVKEIIQPTTKQTNKSKATNSMKSTQNINDTVEREETKVPMKLMDTEELLAVGRSVNASSINSKSDTSRDSEKSNILQQENVTNRTNCNLPSEEIFRACLNLSKCSSNSQSNTGPTLRETINFSENYQIQVSNGISAARNVRYVPNDNGRKEINYGDASHLLMTNGSHTPLDLIAKGSTDKPLPLFPMMHRCIPQMHEQIPQMQEHIPQIQALTSLKIPKPLKSSAILISKELRQSYRNHITKMFDGPCYKFLSNQECDAMCRYKHVLPAVDLIQNRLNSLANEMIQFTYTDFIAKSKLSFEMYFPLICQLYGKRKMRSSFFPLIKDCQKFEKEEYLKFIFDGLILCGLNKRDALLEIVDSCQITSASDATILQIIETDPMNFIEILMICVPRLRLSPNLVTKLLKQAADNPQHGLLRNCTVLLEQIGETIMHIDSNVLNTFCGNIFAMSDDNLSRKVLNIISNSLKLN